MTKEFRYDPDEGEVYQGAKCIGHLEYCDESFFCYFYPYKENGFVKMRGYGWYDIEKRLEKGDTTYDPPKVIYRP